MADRVAYGSLPFKEQIAFFRAKKNVLTEAWTDVWEAEHDHAFMVAGANRIDLLVDLRAAVDKAISQGTGLEAFRRDFDAIVAKHGWAYKGGRNWRTRVIYETNLRASYAAGRYAQLQALKKVRPYWLYRHSDAVQHPRPMHVAWGGMVLDADDPWWNTHYPPNGWGCQCTVEALNARDLKRMGKDGPDTAPPVNMQRVLVGKNGPHPREVETPAGVDPGFGYAPGKSAFGDSTPATPKAPTPPKTPAAPSAPPAPTPTPPKAPAPAPTATSPAPAPAPSPAPTPTPSNVPVPPQLPPPPPPLPTGDIPPQTSLAKTLYEDLLAKITQETLVKATQLPAQAGADAVAELLDNPRVAKTLDDTFNALQLLLIGGSLLADTDPADTPPADVVVGAFDPDLVRALAAAGITPLSATIVATPDTAASVVATGLPAALRHAHAVLVDRATDVVMYVDASAIAGAGLRVVTVQPGSGSYSIAGVMRTTQDSLQARLDAGELLLLRGAL